MTQLHSIRVFDPKQGTRDGLDFSIDVDKKLRRGFITGSALAILRDSLDGTPGEIFEARAPSITAVVSRKVVSTGPEEEILVSSADVTAPK